jgi:hypothetical protein
VGRNGQTSEPFVVSVESLRRRAAPLASLTSGWLNDVSGRRIKVAFLIAVAIVNAYLVAMALFVEPLRATDWNIMRRAAELAGSPQLYELRGINTFVWSPVSAYVLKLLLPISFEAWQVALVASALAMPTWRLRLIVLISWPFWHDWIFGNLLTLIFLASVYAWRGSRIGTIFFFSLALLIPRPLLAPMALWILWKRPAWRWPFVGMFLAHFALVAWSGIGPNWIEALMHLGPEFMDLSWNRGPTRLFGYWWFVAAVPLAAWLFWRGRVGWAGLAISPYVWSYYLFWVLPEVNSVPAGNTPARGRGAMLRDSAANGDRDTATPTA